MLGVVFFWHCTHTTRPTQKNKKKGKKKGLLEDEDAADRLIVHSLDVLESFSRLKLDVPLTVGDVPTALEALVEKRASYVERQRKKLAGEEDPEEAAEEASREAAAAAAKSTRKSKKPDLAAHAFPALGASKAEANGGDASEEEEEEEEDAAGGGEEEEGKEDAPSTSASKPAGGYKVCTGDGVERW